MESGVQVETLHSLSPGKHEKDSEDENLHQWGVKNLMLSIFSMEEMPMSSVQNGERRKKLGAGSGHRKSEEQV